jgi:hypothetical protein
MKYLHLFVLYIKKRSILYALSHRVSAVSRSLMNLEVAEDEGCAQTRV